jgi:hypothetical protein
MPYPVRPQARINHGRDEETRTLGLCFPKAALYLAELHPATEYIPFTRPNCLAFPIPPRADSLARLLFSQFV